MMGYTKTMNIWRPSMHLLEVNLHSVQYWLSDPNRTNRWLDYWKWQIMQKWGQKESQI